jgi:hypothetical protein
MAADSRAGGGAKMTVQFVADASRLRLSDFRGLHATKKIEHGAAIAPSKPAGKILRGRSYAPLFVEPERVARGVGFGGDGSLRGPIQVDGGPAGAESLFDSPGLAETATSADAGSRKNLASAAVKYVGSQPDTAARSALRPEVEVAARVPGEDASERQTVVARLLAV